MSGGEHVSHLRSLLESQLPQVSDLGGAIAYVRDGASPGIRVHSGSAWTPLTAADGILTSSDYGLVSSLTLDQTSLLQAFFNESTSLMKVLDVQVIKITAPLTLSAGGGHVAGIGSGGDFSNYIIASDCKGFNITGCHHWLLENFMIWPQGTTPPTELITLENCYSMVFRDLRIHMASTYWPSVAMIRQRNVGGGCNDIVWDHLILRVDSGGAIPIGMQFDNDCGSCHIANSDIETCSKAIEWLGGHVSVTNTYMERVGGTRALNLNASADANASFTWLGGEVHGQPSGLPIAIDVGAKNVRIVGPYVTRGGGSPYQMWVYDMTGNSNIVIDIANFDTAGVGASVTLDPALIKFVTPRDVFNETVTYSASMTPTFTLGTRFSTATMTATNGTAFTINVPSESLDRYVKPMVGSQLSLVIRNASGGALGVATFAAGYKLGAAWTQPANGFSRTIEFQYNGTNWIEQSRTAADVAN